MAVDDALLTVQRFYSLLAAGDGAGALGLLDPDIDWTEAERTPYFVGTDERHRCSGVRTF